MHSTEGFFYLKKNGLSRHTVDNEVFSHQISFKYISRHFRGLKFKSFRGGTCPRTALVDSR